MKRRLVVFALLILSTACVSPARSYGAYEEKAATTASDALAAVGTARLTIRASFEHRAFVPFVTVLLGESEEHAGSVQGTFDSIQPPDTRSDRLRAELDEILQDAVSQLAEGRIAARRGTFERLGDVDAALKRIAADLNTFLEAHR